MGEKNLIIRNSTAEFLIFQAQSQAEGVEVMYAGETIWCTQDAIATLFGKSRSTITEQLQNIFEEGELVKDSVCRKFRRTASDGKEYSTRFYNLDAIISVGYRANSTRATQFRQWATEYPMSSSRRRGQARCSHTPGIVMARCWHTLPKLYPSPNCTFELGYPLGSPWVHLG